MVQRTFFAYDNDAMLVTASSSPGLVGNGIINNSDTPNGTRFVFQGGFFPRQVVVEDTFQSNLFNDDRGANHVVVSSPFQPAGTRVDSESIIFLRAVDSNGTPFGPTIRLAVFSQPPSFQNVWGFSTTSPLVPGQEYVKTSGSNDGTSLYTDLLATCFAAGTRIRTPDGPRAVEAIRPGETVWTRSAAAARVRWVGARRVPATGRLAPVVFAPGAFGNARELAVSAQHRMLVAGRRAALLFGAPEVLVPARFLVGLPGVTRREGGFVTWCHLMFDRHEIVEAEGALSESFQPGAAARSALDAFAREELLSIFPELGEDGAGVPFPDAAPTLRAHEARALLHRAA